MTQGPKPDGAAVQVVETEGKVKHQATGSAAESAESADSVVQIMQALTTDDKLGPGLLNQCGLDNVSVQMDTNDDHFMTFIPSKPAAADEPAGLTVDKSRKEANSISSSEEDICSQEESTIDEDEVLDAQFFLCVVDCRDGVHRPAIRVEPGSHSDSRCPSRARPARSRRAADGGVPGLCARWGSDCGVVSAAVL